MNITMIGTGFIGLVTGAGFANVGHSVVCYDVDEQKINQLIKGHLPIYEPGLEEMVKHNVDKGRLCFSSYLEQAVSQADVIFITVGTPASVDGNVDLSMVYQSIENVLHYIKKETVLVIKSTIPAGTCRKIAEIVKNQNASIEVVANPEFLRTGNAIYDMSHPNRVVIGANNERAAHTVAQLYEPFQATILHTDWQSAEMIKYAANAFLATKISFINEVANACEKIDANIDDVAKGIGLDERIGTSFLQAGIGYGGSCFPKDTSALVALGEHINSQFTIVEAAKKVNDEQIFRLVEKIELHIGSVHHKKIAVLGLAFKPNTNDIREARSIVLIEELLKRGAIISCYDPEAMNGTKTVFADRISYCNSTEEAIIDVDAAVICTEWDEFKQLSPNQWKKSMSKPNIIDGRNCLDGNLLQENGVHYYGVGR
jgi:UDPglucose 6-dehydrogenase